MTPVLFYIGNTEAYREHFQTLLADIRFSPDAKALLGRSREHTKQPAVLLYEMTDPQSDRRAIDRLKQCFPAHYFVLIGEFSSAEQRSAYLHAGVNHALTPQADDKDILLMLEVARASFARQAESPDQDASQDQTPGVKGYRAPLWKRTFDIVSASCALIVLSPLLLGVAAAIRLESRGPVIYRSKRVGSNYQVFDFLKFRSMYTDADMALKKFAALNQYDASTQENKTGEGTRSAHAMAQAGGVMLISDDCIISETEHLAQTSTQNEQAFVKLENDPRITRVGRFIRKYSIDELPQLLNILKGDMSVVGNRPLPLYEAEKLTSDEYAERFMCPAGLTGLWQVEKRGEAGKLSAEERKMLDIRYARNYSPLMDARIILKTFLAFVQKENV